jgi:hypothetical protein
MNYDADSFALQVKLALEAASKNTLSLKAI